MALTRNAGETDEAHRVRLEAAQRARKAAEVGTIPPPPKYRSADFVDNTCWRLRGPLDVPKERFVSYPHCSRDHDPSLLLGWAGWDDLRQALAGYYTETVEQEGWPAERLTPLLAGWPSCCPGSSNGATRWTPTTRSAWEISSRPTWDPSGNGMASAARP